MRSLCRLWSGELDLDDAFWGWAVIGGLALNLTAILGFMILIAADMVVAAFVVGYAISTPYNVAVIVGVWRSASRAVDKPKRAAIYRTLTVIGMTLLTVA